MGRKPILFIDNSENSNIAINMLKSNNTDYIEYHINNFKDCCGGSPISKVPSLFAPEGIFKNIDEIKKYISMEKLSGSRLNESAYW